MSDGDKATGRARPLSEWESKALLKEHGLPVVEERLVRDLDGALRAASDLGFPVVLKACAPGLAHKTEQGKVKLGIGNGAALERAFDELASAPDGNVLVQVQEQGPRELMVGAVRDAQFGPCVSFGVGGVLAEVLDDVVFRVAPLSRVEAMDMLEGIRAKKVLGEFRGQARVDREALIDVLVGLSEMMAERDDIQEVDVNPLLVRPDGSLVAVDALVVKSG